MNTYSCQHTGHSPLIEQIASQVFGNLPEDGPLIVILDGKGSCCPSDSGKFSSIFSETHLVDQIVARVDDGGDPLISYIGDYAVVATELTSGCAHCGYMIIALPSLAQGSAMENIDLVDTILSMMDIICGLVEKNSRLNHYQTERMDFAHHSEMALLN